MMLLGWLLVGLTLIAGYGWSVRLLREQNWLTVLLGLALSVGLISLIMLWEGLLAIPLSLISIAPPYFVLMLPGWWRVRPSLPTIPTQWEKRFALLILLAICALELFNGAYWPFYRDDTIGIYQPVAQAIYHTQALVPLIGADSLYRAYPVLIPLNYAYAYFASGWENEYLAKAIATLLSLACIPAAYVLGKKLRGERTGWLAAMVLALTPFFGRWASSGYVDLPMAFFYTLAAIFALRLYDSDQTARESLVNAALAGVLIGLAAWTKNAALIGVLLFALWLVWCWLNKRIRPSMIVIGMGMACLVASPWYVRNLLGAGFLIPATAWTDKAQHTLESAFVLVSHPENFGAPGWVILFGVAAAILLDLRRRAPGMLLLLLWTLPFFAAWWWFASYDPRFLLMFLPLLCVLAGDLLARLWKWIGPAWHPRYLIVTILLTLILTAPILLHSVDYKGSILRHPFMSDADKRALVGR